MDDSPTFRERQVRDGLKRCARPMSWSRRRCRWWSRTRRCGCFLVNAGWALYAVEVIVNEAPPPSDSAAFGGQATR